MLKQLYIGVAQTLSHALPRGRALYTPGRELSTHSKWLASLGAIYHLDRMIALDIPWWNVASTLAVEAFLRSRPQARVFEYGSGASTIWLARRSGSVTSVEHDAGWSDKLGIRTAAFANTTVVRAGYDIADDAELQPYVTSIDGSGLYDLIVVDGRLRSRCLQRSLPHLKKDGMILFDDSGRKRYRAAIEQSGLIERHYCGLSYCVPYPDHTSLLTSR